MNKKQVIWLKDATKENLELIGTKGEKLGELIQMGLHIPNGFIITTAAYEQFLKENDLQRIITQLIETINFDIPETVEYASKQIKKYIIQGNMQSELVTKVFSVYKKLGGILQHANVSLQASITDEKIPHASLTFENVQGEANVLLKIKNIWASFFTADQLIYRHEKRVDHKKIGIAVIIQMMVKAEKLGTLYTTNPETNDKKQMMIIINSETLIIDKSSFTSLRASSGTGAAISSESGVRNDMVDILAKIGIKLEKHYFFPQEITWGVEKDIVYILQTKPLTTTVKPSIKHDELPTTNELLLKGTPLTPGIASGSIKYIKHPSDLQKIHTGNILVIEQINLDFLPAMKKASALVLTKEVRTSHPSIISRNIGIPAVLVEKTTLLKEGSIVTVQGTKGEIYKGGFIKPNTHAHSISELKLHTATKVYVQLDNTQNAQSIAAEHIDGVGVLETKHVIKTSIPHLAEEIGSVCKAFTPRPIIYKSVNKQEVFPFELDAVKMVRNKLSLKNLWLMLPMIRTAAELAETKKMISESGLYRSPSFKLILSIDIPAQVISLDTFLQVGIDGVAINTDSLSRYMFGLEGISANEEAMLWAIEHVIKTAHKHKITASIYGKNIAQMPELLEKLVKWGITSITVAPEEIETTRKEISEFEKKLIS